MKFLQRWEGRSLSENRDSFFPAKVPGNIQKDYADANGFYDVQYSTNTTWFIPFEDDHWEYRTTLEYTANEGERVYFVSKGISYKYDVMLDGEIIYSYEGMFRGFEIDITDKLAAGASVLTVHIYPHPKSKRGYKGTRDEANESCNPPVYYGWDWNPRLLISGIWDDTYVETRTVDYIDKCEVLATLNSTLDEGKVSFSYSCSVPCETVLLDADGGEVYRGTDTNITVSAPKLWWCNGQGTPYLYTWIIRNGTEERRGRIGFRRLRLLRNAGCSGPSAFPKGRYEAPITVELNGRRIFCKGSNWVNPELFWGEITEERYRELIDLAVGCNMNIFRMWGGAGLPKESFYDICDEKGMLIWQEFMLACNEYIGKEEYMRTLESEASAIIKKFRCHPALALWCGGNELFNSWSGMDDQSAPLRLLNKLCFELDYERPFLYTSPLYGMGHGGYVFYDPSQGGDAFEQFAKASCTAYTEFGIPAIASVDILRTIIPEEELFPIKDTPSWRIHHAFGAWGDSRWLCRDIINRYFGEPKTLEQMVSASDWLQCEGYRGAFEEMRRQWPRCSMAINWCYNEPWKTAAGNNVIAYPATPRPCYEYIRSALRPTLFSAKVAHFDWNAGQTFEAELWLLNDAPTPADGKVTVTATVGEQSFELIEWSASAAANSNTRGVTVRFVLPDIAADRIVLKLDSTNGYSSTYEYCYKPSPRVRNAIRQLNV
jgi:beta-mannosidase